MGLTYLFIALWILSPIFGTTIADKAGTSEPGATSAGAVACRVAAGVCIFISLKTETNAARLTNLPGDQHLIPVSLSFSGTDAQGAVFPDPSRWR
ncbi:hypothetical protein MJ575_08250 [Klebsiella pneumoniae]|nr:hypothetical protein MJ575_08250 [Klebsiella pneumoniae]